MSEVLTIRGAVRGIKYEAYLKRPDFPVGAGDGTEWLVTAAGVPILAIPATHSLEDQEPARAVIEMELERRLSM